MKKNVKKLRLHRDTLALLDPKMLVAGQAAANVAVVTSCTYPCNCPTGCSEVEICIETGLNA